LKLNFKRLKDSLEFSQNLDVKQLSDIWINFRNKCFETYKIDPFTRSASRFSFEAFLLYSNVEIELLADPEMFMMIESQARGEISITGNKRYAHANNKHVSRNDESKKPYYLIYFDAKNLYEHSLSQKLSFSNYEWGNPK